VFLATAWADLPYVIEYCSIRNNDAVEEARADKPALPIVNISNETRSARVFIIFYWPRQRYSEGMTIATAVTRENSIAVTLRAADPTLCLADHS
jgi:hypothetical protein